MTIGPTRAPRVKSRQPHDFILNDIFMNCPNNQTENPPARANRLELLDVLRGLAVAAVVLVHIHSYVPALWKGQEAFTLGPLAMKIVPVLWFGVDLFYVLSGFFIGTSVLKMPRWSAKEYARHRALRIIPAYYVALLLVIFISQRDLFDSARGMADIALHFGFLHIFQSWSMFGIIGPAWTLGVEWSYYLFMLLAAFWWRSPKGWLLIIAMLLTAILWKTGAWFLAQEENRFFLASQLPGALDEFACGMLVAWLRARGFFTLGARQSRLWLALAAIVAGLIFTAVWIHFFYQAPGYWDYFHMVIFSRLWLAAGFAMWVMAGIWLSDFACAIRIGKYTGLMGLGRISYSVYLYHVPVFLWLAHAVPQWPGDFTPLLMAVATLAVAWASYRLVERRFYPNA